MEYKGSIAGKRILVSGGGGSTTVEQLRQYLRRFPARDFLRYVGKVAGHVHRERLPGVTLQGVDVPAYCLPYLALLSIESSNDYRGKPPDDAAFARAAEMFVGLEDPMTDEHLPQEGRSALEFLMRLGRQQFEGQAEFRHLLPRTLVILRDLWPKVPKAAGVSLDASLRIITGGLSLEETVLHGVVATSVGGDGIIHPLTAAEVASWDSGLSDAVRPEAFATLVDWLSATYAQVRAAAKADMPADSYDQYRFNPLEVWPIVVPDVDPLPGRSTRIVPFPRFIWERVTRGLYHDLSRHHDGGRGCNPFRVAFGHVFQEYVGLLLREALGTERVMSEFRYGPRSASSDSPDWIVIEGDTAVLVEVKQSALFRRTKLWGHLDDARDDLRKTLMKAVEQLVGFEQHVADGRQGLDRFQCVRRFERLVVTYDNLHFANWIVRNEIMETRQRNGAQPTHVHVAPVEDFEYILGRCGHGSLFDLLERKHNDAEQDEMDFHDWLGLHLTAEGEDTRNPYLDRVYREWMAGYGMTRR